MRIDEPTTFATDLGIAALAGFLAARLLRAGRAEGRGPVRRWGFAFAALAAASLLGGLEHGLGPSLGPGPDALLWRGALLGISAAAFLLLDAALGAGFRPPLRGRLAVAALAAFGMGAFAVAWRQEFAGALVLYGAALAGVCGILVAAPGCRGGPATRWVLSGVAVSALAGWIQASGPDLHPDFNHNDLYHVVQAPGLWLLYRGGLLLRGPAEGAGPPDPRIRGGSGSGSVPPL